MTITFNGIPLLLEDPEGRVSAHVDKYLEWPRSLVNPPSRSIDSKSRIQRPQWPLPPRLKPNQLYWPTGATRWGQFIGLATTDNLNLIYASLSSTSSLGTLGFTLSVLSSPPNVPVVSGESIDGTFDLQGLMTAQMYLLPAVPVSDQDEETLWILPFVDQRYWWQQQLFMTNLAIEGSSSSASSSSGPPSSWKTWDQFLSQINASLGALIVRDTSVAINANYGIPDNCFFNEGIINTAAALDVYCWTTNQRLTALPTTGQFILRSSTTASALYDAEKIAQSVTSGSGVFAAGGDWQNEFNGDVPNQIQFHFTDDTNVDAIVYNAGVASSSSSSSSGTPAPVIPAWATGLTLDVWSPAATIAGSSVLQSMANQWAKDFWAWTVTRFSWGWNKILDWHQTGYEDYTLYDMSRSARGYQARTFVKSLSPSWGWDFVPFQVAGTVRDCGTGGNSPSSSSTSGTCGCCDCTDCINAAQAPVGQCTACPNGAADTYQVDIGGIYGMITLTYSEDSSSSSSPRGPCIWTSAPFTASAPAWTADTYYQTGDYVTNDGNSYICTLAGKSAASGGPTGTGSAITDGSALWGYVS